MSAGSAVTPSSMEAAKAVVKNYTTGKTSLRKKLLSDLTLASIAGGASLHPHTYIYIDGLHIHCI